MSKLSCDVLRTGLRKSCRMLYDDPSVRFLSAEALLHSSVPKQSAESLTDEADTSIFPVEHMLPFVLVTALFFLWGMSNNLTDILVQQFKKSFELSPLQAQLVQTAVSSATSPWLFRRRC